MLKLSTSLKYYFVSILVLIFTCGCEQDKGRDYDPLLLGYWNWIETAYGGGEINSEPYRIDRPVHYGDFISHYSKDGKHYIGTINSNVDSFRLDYYWYTHHHKIIVIDIHVDNNIAYLDYYFPNDSMLVEMFWDDSNWVKLTYINVDNLYQ